MRRAGPECSSVMALLDGRLVNPGGIGGARRVSVQCRATLDPLGAVEGRGDRSLAKISAAAHGACSRLSGASRAAVFCCRPPVRAWQRGAIPVTGDIALSAVALLLGAVAWNVPDCLVVRVVGGVLAVLAAWLAVESVVDRRARRSRRR